MNLLLLVASALSCILVITRIMWTLELTYISLIWNLFLAWIPYILSYQFRKKNFKQKNKFITFGWILLWLIFYPNAPYIITDLFHLNERAGAPLWYDLILIFSFAGLGLLLGLLSLKDMQYIITRKYNIKTGWWFIIVSLFLSGFGIYIGRYLRWNSWDVVAQTSALSRDLWHIFRNPVENISVFAFTILFACFQIIIYYSFIKYNQLIKQNIKF